MNSEGANLGRKTLSQRVEVINEEVALTLIYPNGEEFTYWIDLDLLEKVNEFNWYRLGKNDLARTGERFDRGYLHWLPLGKPPEGMKIHHIDGDLQNCRRKNLQIVSHRTRSHHLDNHGEWGPCINYELIRGKYEVWRVNIAIGGKPIYKPGFRDPDMAVACRDAYLLIAHQVDGKERALPSKEELKAISDACRRIK